MFSREFGCCRGCQWCADGSCGWRVNIESPVGNNIGYVKQRLVPRDFLHTVLV